MPRVKRYMFWGVAAKGAKRGQPMLVKGAYATAAKKADVTPAIAGYALFSSKGEAERFRDTVARMYRVPASDYAVARFHVSAQDYVTLKGTDQ